MNDNVCLLKKKTHNTCAPISNRLLIQTKSLLYIQLILSISSDSKFLCAVNIPEIWDAPIPRSTTETMDDSNDRVVVLFNSHCNIGFDELIGSL